MAKTIEEIIAYINRLKEVAIKKNSKTEDIADIFGRIIFESIEGDFCCSSIGKKKFKPLPELEEIDITAEIKNIYDKLNTKIAALNAELVDAYVEVDASEEERDEALKKLKECQAKPKTTNVKESQEYKELQTQLTNEKNKCKELEKQLTTCNNNLDRERNNYREIEAENNANKNQVTLYRAEVNKFKQQLEECKNKPIPFGIDEIIAPLDIFDADTVEDLTKTLDELIAQPKEKDQSEDEYQENKKYYGLLKTLFNNTDKKLTEIYSDLTELVNSTMIGWSGIWLKLHEEKDKN